MFLVSGQRQINLQQHNVSLSLHLSPSSPQLVEVVLALVGALHDLALVQHVVHHHRVHADLELPEELTVVPAELGDEPGPGDEQCELDEV